MTPTTLRAPLLVLLALALAGGCGPNTLRPETSGPSVSLGGQASRRIETLTDLEEVRAVAQHGGLLHVATDAGLLRFPSVEAPAQLIEGLPSQDIRGLVEHGSGLLVATAAGMVQLEGETVTPLEGAPQLGHLTDMAATTDGTVWLCGLGGLAKLGEEGGWQVYSEAGHCTDLAPTPEGQLWVGTTRGLWYVEGEIVREHPIGGGMAEGYVREIVPVLPGQIMAILQGANRSQLGYWDGDRWYAYTLRGLEGQAVGLVRRGNDVLLITQHRVLEIAPRGAGVPLSPLSSAEGNVRSFRPTLVAASEYPAREANPAELLAEPLELTEVPDNHPTIDAPSFVAAPVDLDIPGRLYRAFVQGAEAFLAVANGGVMHLRADGRTRVLRSLSLVPEEALSIATDSSGATWMLSRDAHLARFVNDRLRRRAVPEGHVAQALATGPSGAYLVTIEPSVGPNAVRVFNNAGAGWRPFASAELTLPAELVSVPFAAVAPDGAVWLALQINREDGPGQRMRGVAVLSAGSDTVLYHHRGADRDAGELALPDEVSAMDFDTESAWFATLSGLVRLGGGQAVVFGETRGVRGEVVLDIAVGNDVVWLTAGEGLGSYDRSDFDFSHPATVQDTRPSHVAVDVAGHLWVGSSEGLVLHEGEEWRLIDADDGLPNADLRDVEVDEAGRVWLLAEDRVMVLER